MATRLTDRRVASARATTARLELWDAIEPGLGLRVTMTGAKSWTFRYRLLKDKRAHVATQTSALRRLTLGPYPTITLAKARALARAARLEVSAGRDPARAKQERRDADTVADLVERYLELHARPRKRSWKADARMLARDVLPTWRHRIPRDVRRLDVRELLQTIADRGAPIGANRVRAVLHKLFAFALSIDVVDFNPVTGTPRPGVEASRDRVLSDDELRVFWKALEPAPAAAAALWKVRAYTAQRGGEVARMRWADVDLARGWWTIPATHAKNKLPHRVPLVASVVDLLKPLRGDKPHAFVFQGTRGKHQHARVAADFGVEDFRGHDLRRTAATTMTSAGTSRLVVGKVLNHVERGVTAVYDRHSYDAEKRQALELWARRLEAIVSADAGAPATVVNFPR